MKLANKLLFILALLFYGVAQAEETPRDFFNQYVFLGDKFDLAVLDLYDENALILGFRVYPHDLERNMQFFLVGSQL